MSKLDEMLNQSFIVEEEEDDEIIPAFSGEFQSPTPAEGNELDLMLEQNFRETDDLPPLKDVPTAGEPLSDAEVFFSRFGDNIITRAATRPLGSAVELGRRAMGMDPKPFPTQTPFLEPLLSDEDIDRDQRGVAMLGDIMGEGLTTGLLAAGLSRALLGRLLTGPTRQSAVLDEATDVGVGAGRQVAAGAGMQSFKGLAAQRSTMMQSRRNYVLDIQDKIAKGKIAPAEGLKTIAHLDESLAALDVAGGPGKVTRVTGDFLLNVLATSASAPRAAVMAEVGAATGGSTVGFLGSQIGVSEGGTGEALAGVGAFIGGVFSGPALASRLKGIADTSTSKFKKFFLDWSNKDPLKNPEINELGRRVITLAASNKGTTPEALMSDLTEALRRVDSLGDENVSALARKMPVGSLSGNDALISFQRNSARHSATAAGNNKENVTNFLEGLDEMNALLRATGNEEHLAMAVATRRAYFQQLVDGRIANARDSAMTAFNNILPGAVRRGASASDVRRQASEALHNNLRGALGEMRRVETSLYKTIAGDVTVQTGTPGWRQLENRFDLLRRSLLEEDFNEIPRIRTIERLIKQEADAGDVPNFDEAFALGVDEGTILDAMKGVDGELPTVEQLMNFRSTLMDRATALRPKAPNMARRVSGLAEDIKTIIDDQSIPGLEVAREFSTELNNVFTRSIVGEKLLARDAAGAWEVSPEALLGQLLSGRGDNSVINLDEVLRFTELGDVSRSVTGGRSEVGRVLRERERLSGAVGETITRGELEDALMFGFDSKYGSSVMDESELFIRSLADQFRGANGEVNFNRLSTFIANNRDSGILQRFHDLEGDLMDASSAAALLQRVEARSKRVTSSQSQRRLFGSLISANGEVLNPTPVVQKVLSGQNREQGLTALINMAKRVPKTADAATAEGLRVPTVEDALAGARATILDAVYANARAQGSTRAGPNWSVVRDQLYTVRSGDSKSVIQLMEENGLLGKEELRRLDVMLDQLVTTQNAMLNPSDIDNMFDATDKTNIFKEFVVTVGGSAAGTGLYQGITSAVGISGGSGAISAAGRGASGAQELILGGKDAKVHNLVIEAISNADLFKRLMQGYDPADPEQVQAAARQLDAVLLALGYESLERTADNIVRPGEEEFFPEIPEPVEEPIPVDEPDFFEQLRGGQ